jgi:hypothetical protein
MTSELPINGKVFAVPCDGNALYSERIGRGGCTGRFAIFRTRLFFMVLIRFNSGSEDLAGAMVESVAPGQEQGVHEFRN